MSTQLTELVPILHELRRAEKLYVIQFLVSELAQEEAAILHTDIVKPDMEFEFWSPYDDAEAAEVMLQVLAETKARNNA